MERKSAVAAVASYNNVVYRCSSRVSIKLRQRFHPLTLTSVIAVQGLASTYEWTWTKELSDGSSVMWLRDLLPADLPDARIMSFEYDSRWLHDPSLVTLEDCGDRLLESIIWDRTHKGSKQMCPIMVIIHAPYFHHPTLNMIRQDVLSFSSGIVLEDS
jgi:hypothetical protein